MIKDHRAEGINLVIQYVNIEALSAWYQSVSKRPWEERYVLEQVFQRSIAHRQEEFILTPAETKSGLEERYPFQVQHINCCGSDQMFIQF